MVSSSPRGEDRLADAGLRPPGPEQDQPDFSDPCGRRSGSPVHRRRGRGKPPSPCLKTQCRRRGGRATCSPAPPILSLYPHDKRPEIIGNFIRSLARARVIIHGLASSPSAISAVLSSRRKKAAVQQLFQDFHFPSFDSPQDFFAAQPPPEEYVQKVVATYQEKIIKVYWIVPQPDLDLWGMSISSADILEGLANALHGPGGLWA